jgi:ribosome-interacting GTPase 1
VRPAICGDAATMSYKCGMAIASFARADSNRVHYMLLTCFYRRWDKLNLVRVYTKPKGKQPDYSAPVVLRAGKCTVEDFVSSPDKSRELGKRLTRQTAV